jgi:hypothetical protein
MREGKKGREREENKRSVEISGMKTNDGIA